MIAFMPTKTMSLSLAFFAIIVHRARFLQKHLHRRNSRSCTTNSVQNPTEQRERKHEILQPAIGIIKVGAVIWLQVCPFCLHDDPVYCLVKSIPGFRQNRG